MPNESKLTACRKAYEMIAWYEHISFQTMYRHSFYKDGSWHYIGHHHDYTF